MYDSPLSFQSDVRAYKYVWRRRLNGEYIRPERHVDKKRKMRGSDTHSSVCLYSWRAFHLCTAEQKLTCTEMYGCCSDALEALRRKL